MPIGLTGWSALYNIYSQERNRGDQVQLNEHNFRMQKQFAKNQLHWKITDAARHGIHPLAAIGAPPGVMPTIPMQGANNQGLQSQLSNMLAEQGKSKNIVDEQLKQYALVEAQQRQYDRQYEYELLIPVRHKDHPTKTVWAFNPRYLAFGTFATLTVMAANKDLAKQLMQEQLTPEENTKFRKLLEHFNLIQRQSNPKTTKRRPDIRKRNLQKQQQWKDNRERMRKFMKGG